MRSLFIILLAGYAVRSDENNYYVIEMPDDPPMQTKKPFNVYWNVPTMQCSSKKIPFENLYEKFGIIQNDNDRFKGEKITILYDPGLFPALFKNETSGKFRFRNGGVPQEGDLTKHLDEFKKELDHSIPDKNFSGIGIIDFESWRPTFRQNFGVLQPYKDVSIEIERKLHWWWKKSWIEAEAKRRFEEAARTYMQTTLSVAKQLRPNALWGFYGFPYCFNMASNNMVEQCASRVPEENDQISWLWSESTALYPSVYSSVYLSTSQLVSLIRGRIREAARCSRTHSGPTDILPYFWFRYRDSGFLTETDLTIALSTLYESNATGILIWGSSNDVNSVAKCNKLHNYVETVLGPAIAKYTKPPTKLSDENGTANKTCSSNKINTESPTFNENLSTKLYPDPEFHWNPPENYSQDIRNRVGEEIRRKFRQNVTDDNDNNAVLQNNSVLIDLILNTVLNNVDNVSSTSTDTPKTTNDMKNQQENERLVNNTTELNVNASTDTSQDTNIVVTNNPVFKNKNTSQQNDSQSVESTESSKIISTEKLRTQTDKTDTQSQSESKTTYYFTIINTTDRSNEATEKDFSIALDKNDDFLFNVEPLTNDNFTTENLTDNPTTGPTATDLETEQTKNHKKASVNLFELKKAGPETDILIDTTTTYKNSKSQAKITDLHFTTESFTESIKNTTTETTERNEEMFERSTISITKYIDFTETTTKPTEILTSLKTTSEKYIDDIIKLSYKNNLENFPELEDSESFNITSTPNPNSTELKAFDESDFMGNEQNITKNLEHTDNSTEETKSAASDVSTVVDKKLNVTENVENEDNTTEECRGCTTSNKTLMEETSTSVLATASTEQVVVY